MSRQIRQIMAAKVTQVGNIYQVVVLLPLPVNEKYVVIRVSGIGENMSNVEVAELDPDVDPFEASRGATEGAA